MTFKLGATQFLILRPMILVISMILWVEGRYEYISDDGRMQVCDLVMLSFFLGLIAVASPHCSANLVAHQTIP